MAEPDLESTYKGHSSQRGKSEEAHAFPAPLLRWHKLWSDVHFGYMLGHVQTFQSETSVLQSCPEPFNTSPTQIPVLAPSTLQYTWNFPYFVALHQISSTSWAAFVTARLRVQVAMCRMPSRDSLLDFLTTQWLHYQLNSPESSHACWLHVATHDHGTFANRNLSTLTLTLTHSLTCVRARPHVLRHAADTAAL